MKSEETHILGELLTRSATGNLLARRLFADWPTWNALKDEFVRQYCKNSRMSKQDIVICATAMIVEVTPKPRSTIDKR